MIGANQKIEFEKRCRANWQMQAHGASMYRMVCRTCGTILSVGGTPKCLDKGITVGQYVKEIFKTT